MPIANPVPLVIEIKKQAQQLKQTATLVKGVNKWVFDASDLPTLNGLHLYIYSYELHKQHVQGSEVSTLLHEEVEAAAKQHNVLVTINQYL